MCWMLSILPLLLRTLPLPARLIFWMLATLAGVRWTLCLDFHVLMATDVNSFSYLLAV